MGRYDRDKELAAARGFTSVRGMRRANRLPHGLEDFLAMPEPVRLARADAEAAIRVARRERIPVEIAARRKHTSVATARWWFPDALRPTRRGRTRPTRADRYLRVRTFISGDERVFVAVRGSRAADRAQEANALQWLYVHGRADAVQLERLRGLEIGGRLVQSDPDELLEIARRGEFDPGRALSGAHVMSEFLCYCGRPASELHHPTARVAGAASSYLDPDFKIAACHDDHALLGDDQLRMADLEPELAASDVTIFDRIEVRLERVAEFIGRVAGALQVAVVVAILAGLATHLERWATELRRGDRDPGRLHARVAYAARDAWMRG